MITALLSPEAPAWTHPLREPNTTTSPSALISAPGFTSARTTTSPWCSRDWPERKVDFMKRASVMFRLRAPFLLWRLLRLSMIDSMAEVDSPEVADSIDGAGACSGSTISLWAAALADSAEGGGLISN